MSGTSAVTAVIDAGTAQSIILLMLFSRWSNRSLYFIGFKCAYSKIGAIVMIAAIIHTYY